MVLRASRVVGICERFADKQGLMYNVNKSEIMVFNNKSKKYDCNVLNIKLHKSKYLGHWLTPDPKDDEDIERERRALSVKAK